ncbi:MAG: preprotein translocase subunit YajC [Legionellales bacterium]|nr:preprotein translocase subunit YajC [Legionellales bacterium]
MDGLIQVAHAADVAATGKEGAWSSILLLVGFVLIFYFLLWRPQSKRAKEHRELVGSLSEGDEIVTGGGVIGTIKKIKDDFLVMDVASGVQMKVQRSAVAKVLPKGTIAAIDE